jgi:hypothetical protein
VRDLFDSYHHNLYQGSGIKTFTKVDSLQNERKYGIPGFALKSIMLKEK